MGIEIEGQSEEWMKWDHKDRVRLRKAERNLTGI